jgi:hypothetical protein
MRRFLGFFLALGVLASVVVLAAPAGAADAPGVAAPPAGARADSPVGTWSRLDDQGKFGGVTLIIEAWDKTAKLTYVFAGKGDVRFSVVSPLDGSDAPLTVDGSPSGEGMAIKKVDKHHAVTVLKRNGQIVGTSKSTFSDDFAQLTVETDYGKSAAGISLGRQTEVWMRVK